MTRTAGVVLGLIALALAGCGGRAGGVGAAPGGVDLPPVSRALGSITGQRCRYVAGPWPRLEVLARPGLRGSIALWGYRQAAGDTAVVSVRYDEDGRRAWARTVAATVPRGRWPELERVVASFLGEDGPADWGFQLRVVAGDVAGVSPSVVCEARPGSGNALSIRPMGTVREMAEFYRARGRSFRVSVALDGDGRVRGVRMSRTSGSRILDEAVVFQVQQWHFLPRLHDGLGVPTVLEVPIRLRSR